MVFKLEVEIQLGQELRAAKRSMDLGIPESRQHCQHIQLKLSKTRVIFVDSMQGGAISQKKSRPAIILHEAADFSGLDQQIS